MSGINKVILVGNLGKDPEVKKLGDQSVCNFTIATSEKWTKDGEDKEKTEWHRVTVWGKLAEICGKYLAKGKQVYVEGKLQTRSYDKEGTTVYTTEIIASNVQFLGGKVAETDNVSAPIGTHKPHNYAPGADNSESELGF